jgi:hypothetical protein
MFQQGQGYLLTPTNRGWHVHMGSRAAALPQILRNIKLNVGIKVLLGDMYFLYKIIN